MRDLMLWVLAVVLFASAMEICRGLDGIAEAVQELAEERGD